MDASDKFCGPSRLKICKFFMHKESNIERSYDLLSHNYKEVSHNHEIRNLIMRKDLWMECASVNTKPATIKVQKKTSIVIIQ